MLDDLQAFTSATDPIWQWLAVMAIAAIPFVESYFAGPIGIIAGVPPVVAVLAAIAGNVISMVVVVLLATKARDARRNPPPPTPRRERFMRAFDKYGVAGVSLLGQTMLPSQITSGILAGVGASPRRIILWQIISIILWGVGFSVVAYFAVDAFQR